jgi:hypothetical protein
MWFWIWNVSVSNIPNGKKPLVGEACEKFLMFEPNDTKDDPTLYVAGGSDALPTSAEPDQIAVELRDIIWKAAGTQTPIFFAMESAESCDDDGNSLDDEPIHEYLFDAEHTGLLAL